MKSISYRTIAVYAISILTLLTSCSKAGFTKIEKGVSQKLAIKRAAQLSDVKYRLHFSIPSGKSDPIDSTVEISVSISDNKSPLILDFKEKKSSVKSVKTNNRDTEYHFSNGHIIIPSRYLTKGTNTINIDFIAGDLSLNRNQEYLYTLFVPDRASTAFPCFDQPDIKALYTLSLEIPEEWVAVANGVLKSKTVKNSRKQCTFSETKPLSTYLFSFVAGKFQKITREFKGREMSLYHRESDKQRIESNVDTIFKTLFDSLNWMENYTDIPYPFAKYDLIAIPSFQYGGMEHTGATLYRASKLFLEDGATITQKLARANLIAHETAHMWFGDLVTMKWFDDVWMKEVFANFMADKIVNPWFKDIDHKLKFLYAHYPKAWSIDRTSGANPIAQKLDNMSNAGTLYGQIIYHKSPIVMDHLEQFIGKEAMQKGLQKYLKQYSYGNSTYKDLIKILSEISGENLEEWSRIWLDSPGMPLIKNNLKLNSGKIDSFTISQTDPFNRKRVWKQKLLLSIYRNGKTENLKIDFNKPELDLTKALKGKSPDFILLNGSSSGYGTFIYSTSSADWLLKNLHTVNPPLLRGTAWLNLWENFLNGKIESSKMANCLLVNLRKEKNQIILSHMLSHTINFYWNFLTEENRRKYSESIDKILWKRFTTAENPGVKTQFFRTWMRVAESYHAVKRMENIWSGKTELKRFKVSREDMTTLAYELSVRSVPNHSMILYKQQQKLKDQEKRDKMAFISRAVSSDRATREIFFESLKSSKNREREPWVNSALHYLHHPLRRAESLDFIEPSLELLEEIQKTGDIFFPINWTNYTLKNHNSKEAADIVRNFLAKRPDYPGNLKNKILQAADSLFRASELQ